VRAAAPKDHYTRDEVQRLLGISARQLKSWHEQRLVPASDTYSFHDLIALRAVLKLRRDKMPPARIRQAVTALKSKLGESSDPLTEVKLYADGRRIRAQVGEQRMEAISGQLLLDFDREELDKLLTFPKKKESSQTAETSRKREAECWFQKGLEQEARGAPFEDVSGAYEKAIELDPTFSAAMVNLGTLYFHARNLHVSADYYRKALEANPDYALAHFNLGNLYDEQNDPVQAMFHYQAALRLDATYADAHYNLALLYQTGGEVMKALQQWSAYLKLDPGSSWAGIARRELHKLRAATIVR
jgi:tetratricopeptide (TPR) repeat protein